MCFFTRQSKNMEKLSPNWAQLFVCTRKKTVRVAKTRQSPVQARIQRVQEPMSGAVLLLCKICTEAVPKIGQGMHKAQDIGRNI